MNDTRRLHNLRAEFKILLMEHFELLLNQGHDYNDGTWSHDFMSDGEYFIYLIGLDPSKSRYNIEDINEAASEAIDTILTRAELGE